MHYRVLFDASSNGSQLGFFVLFPIFFSTFGLIAYALKDSKEPGYANKATMFLVVGTLASALSLLFLLGVSWEYRTAKRELATHNFKVAEGAVEDFIPMPPGGHSTESFTLGGTHFRYGSGWGSITFNSEWNKGFLHDGVQARISYDQAGEILRVEVK